MFLQQSGDHPPGHGGGDFLRLNLGEQDVAAHDGGNTFGNGPAEGNQFPSFQFLQTLVDAGQT